MPLPQPRTSPRQGSVERGRRSGLLPLGRLLGLAWAAAGGRLALALRAPFARPAARRAQRRAWEERLAARSVRTLGDLKGVYVKAGQFAASRHDLLPASATAALAQLRDRVPPLPLEDLRPLLEAELGTPLEQCFAAIEPVALGAASIAQVHRARLHSGEEVAVKIQYPWLRASLPRDLALVRLVLGAALRFRRSRGVDAGRLFDEFERGLREELDFEREAAVAREIAANLADEARIVVPAIFPSHSTGRVLTMQFQPAVPLHDRAALERLGIAPREVLEIVGRAYAKQVFVDGLFHADPHPGNLFVLDEPGADRRPRVLFVDFGLSRRLAPELRAELRQGLAALLKRDREAFLAGMQRLGMVAPGAEAAVAAAVGQMLARIGSEGGALAVPGSRVLALKDEAKSLLGRTPGLQLPNDLLLFAKTLTHVFGLGRELDPELDLVRLCLPYLLRFLTEEG